MVGWHHRLNGHDLPRDPWALPGKSGSVSCGVTAPFSWVLVPTRFYLCLEACRFLVPQPGSKPVAVNVLGPNRGSTGEVPTDHHLKTGFCLVGFAIICKEGISSP